MRARFGLELAGPLGVAEDLRVPELPGESLYRLLALEDLSLEALELLPRALLDLAPLAVPLHEGPW